MGGEGGEGGGLSHHAPQLKLTKKKKAKLQPIEQAFTISSCLIGVLPQH